MKGFYPKQNIHRTKEVAPHGLPSSTLRLSDINIEETEKRHQIMLDAGFGYDEVNNFYYTEEGALVNDNCDSIEDLLGYQQYKECADDGYEFGYGKPTPFGMQNNKTSAIYCTNYQEIVAKHGIVSTGPVPALK